MPIQEKLKKVCDALKKLRVEVKNYKEKNEGIDYQANIAQNRLGKIDFFTEIKARSAKLQILLEDEPEIKEKDDKEFLLESIAILHDDFMEFKNISDVSDEAKKMCDAVLADMEALKKELEPPKKGTELKK